MDEHIYQEKSGFLNHNNIRLKEIGSDYCILQCELNEQSLNPLGNVHGGLYFSLADSAAGAAARTQGGVYVTLNGSINYLAPASIGTIYAKGTIVRSGRTTSVINVTVTDDVDRLLSVCTFTMFRIQ